MRSLASIISVCVLMPEAVLAEPGKFADPNAVSALPVSGVSSVGYVTIALAVVLALIYAAAWLLRRLKSFNGISKSSLTVVEAVSVGAKERVVLIRVKDRQVLLGVAPGRVNMLVDIGIVEDTPTTPATTDTAPQPPTFKQLLKKSMGLS